MNRPALLLAVAMATSPGSAAADGYFALRPGIVLESGDSWIDAGQRYRLYGVQACLRGTFYTDDSGIRRDCGEASLAVLAAYIADTKPVCAAVVKSAETRYVACYATIGADRLDLANLLIASGYAFAALNSDSLPQHPPYAVIEQAARQERAGLWQFKDVQHPSVLLGNAARTGDGR